MKFIITEEQYDNLYLRRRLSEIMDEVLFIIDIADEVYGNIDFCSQYPTFKSYMVNLVDEIIGLYNNMTGHHIWEFIYEDIGHENFIDMLLDAHGDEIKNLYNERIKDC